MLHRYNVLVRSGDQLGEHTFGLLLDKDMQPIIRDGEPFVSYGNGLPPPAIVVHAVLLY